MPSLSTTYGISILLASITGIGSAFLANKFVPMIPEPAEISSVTVEPIKEEPAPSAPPEVPSKVAYEELPPAELPNAVPPVASAPPEDENPSGGSKQEITISSFQH
jgi:hypothetical protein